MSKLISVRLSPDLDTALRDHVRKSEDTHSISDAVDQALRAWLTGRKVKVQERGDYNWRIYSRTAKAPAAKIQRKTAVKHRRSTKARKTQKPRKRG